MRRGFTETEVVAQLGNLQGERTNKEFAHLIGCSQQYLGDILNGRAKPGKLVLKFLGLENGYIKSENRSN